MFNLGILFVIHKVQYNIALIFFPVLKLLNVIVYQHETRLRLLMEHINVYFKA